MPDVLWIAHRVDMRNRCIRCHRPGIPSGMKGSPFICEGMCWLEDFPTPVTGLRQGVRS